jgi:PhoH-like ATPase
VVTKAHDPHTAGVDGATCPAAGPTDAPGTRVAYVLDTSVLLSDPKALFRFEEHDVVLPVVVISELEAKRDHPELGYFARSALRILDDLRVEHGGLDRPIPVGDVGGTLRVELGHTDATVLPSGLGAGGNDTRILAVAANLARAGRSVTVVSKDLPMRVKASAVGLRAEEYRAQMAVDSGWTGMDTLDLTERQMADLWEHETLDLVDVDGAAERNLRCHTGLVIHSARGSALGRVTADKQVRLVRGDRDAFGVHGRSA